MSQIPAGIDALSPQQLAALFDKLRPAAAPEATVGIPTVARRSEGSPLSTAQERLWFLDRLDPGSAAYHVAGAVRLEGELDPDALERSLREVVARHEALRTVFTGGGEEAPKQRVLSDIAMDLPRIDVADLDATAVAELEQRFATAPFDLATGPLLRALLVRRDDRHHDLLLALHHIVSDGASLAVFVGEIAEFYGAARSARDPQLAELPIQYIDYAAWERARAEEPKREEALEARRKVLEGAPVLELPTDRPRPAERTSDGVQVAVELPADLVATLQGLADRSSTTLFTVLLAGFAAHLRWLGAGEDVVLGSPVANRPRRELEGMIGFFVNTMALRLQPAGGLSFAELVTAAATETSAALEHGDLPFERLVDALVPRRDLARPPLVQALLALDEGGAELVLEGLTARLEDLPTGTAKMDLLLQLRKRADGGLSGWLELAQDLFDESTGRRSMDQFVRLLEQAAGDPERPLASLVPLSPAEAHQVLAGWNDRPLAQDNGTLQDLFALAVQNHQGATALVAGDERLTYGELAARVASTATLLRGRGVGPEALVAIRMERGASAVVALLAVLEAGGAYVPVDPDYPESRQVHLVRDSGAHLLLVAPEDELPGQLAAELPESLEVLPILAEPALEGELTGGGASHHLAYLIYTSGSTGTPKGVAIEHRSARALVAWAEATYGPDELRAVLAATSFCFDLSIFELFATFHRGGTVVLAQNALALLEGRVPEVELSLINTVPSAATEILRAGALPPSVGTVNLAGEPLRGRLADALYATGTVERVWNLYGPSEDTTYSTAAPISRDAALRGPGGEPTLGRGLPGTTTYVLDRRGLPRGVGLVGEIVLGGRGLARGYHGRPAATAERFVPHPWGGAGERLYRTGDLGRFLPDGRLELSGRVDHQVKVRGHRIELGEVETAMGRLDGVRDAAVIVTGGAAHERRLEAFVVLTAGEASTLGSDLRQHLPGPMVPSIFHGVETLPLTPNGKVDRKALAALAAEAQAVETPEADFIAPETALEELVVSVFADLLDRSAVSTADDFFTLGGHSLLAARAAAVLGDRLEREVPVSWLFEAPAARDLARRLEQAPQGAAPVQVVPAERPAEIPLTPAQERLWFLERLEQGSAVYHLPFAFDLRGALHAEALERALGALVERHGTLRTVYPEVSGRPQQEILDTIGFTCPQVDLEGEGDAAGRAEAIARDLARSPFDLAVDPPLRGRLLRFSEEHHRLLLVLHHIAVDGWSLGVLFAELSALYAAALGQGEVPQAPPVDFVDYTLWHRERLNDEHLRALVDGARQRLSDAPATLELPLDRPRPPRASSVGGTVDLHLPGLAASLEAASQRLGATPFMVLLAAFDAALWGWSGRRDLVVGTPFANRDRPELAGLVGLLVNTLVLRTQVAPEMPFQQVVEAARRATLEAHDERDLPFERLVQELEPQRDLSRPPVHQVMLVLQSAPLEAPNFHGVDVTLEALDTGAVRSELTAAWYVSGDDLRGALEYRSDLFDTTTALRFAGRLERLLVAALEAPEAPLVALDVLPPVERHQLLYEMHGDPVQVSPGETLYGRILGRAAETPNADAVVASDGSSRTYSELMAAAAAVSTVLDSTGTGPGDVVAVCGGRTPETLAALLGVWGTGAAYLPLDPAYPEDRLHFMLEDSGARVLLTEESLAQRFATSGVERVFLDRIPTTPDPATPTRSMGSATDLAYLIYTSGSTGVPKAVAIEHGSALALVEWSEGAFSDEEMGGVLASTSLCFDLSIFELFITLSRGGLVILADNALALPTHPAAHRVRLLNTVPSAALELVRGPGLPATVETVNLAGEPLRRELVDALYALPGVERVWNLYGPSEDTTYSTAVRVPNEAAEPTIGRPVDGTRALVLDAALRTVPLGATGELYLSGLGLARGYLGRPALTADRWLPDPQSEEVGGRMYRTGDLVRRRADGELEYRGRIDHQVKIRGFRIELSEIEAALVRHAGVGEAAVLAVPGPGGGLQLAAWTSRSGEEEATSESLRYYLAEKLPASMVPSVFQVRDELPHTPNGKIDRKALKREGPVHAPTDGTFRAPEGEVEERLASLFAEVLERERVGADDDFFLAGGHSLLAVRLLSRVEESFGVKLEVATLFEAPTVAGLARCLADAPERAEKVGEPSFDRSERSERPDPSFIQERLWFLDSLEGDSEAGARAFNMPLVLRLAGELRKDLLLEALNDVVARHEVLRTIFPAEDGQPWQRVLEPSDVELPVTWVDLRPLAPEVRSARLAERLEATVAAPFDLAKGPLVRVLLARTEDAEHTLALVAHHTVFDGWSAGILLQELGTFYSARLEGTASGLEPLTLQYAEVAARQRADAEAEGDEALHALVERLQDLPAGLDLPTDRPRGQSRSFRAGRSHLRLEAEEWSVFEDLCRREGVTLYMALGALFGALLGRWSGQETVAVGSPVAARRGASEEALIGPFLNTQVLRLDPGMEGLDFRGLLAQSKERALEALGARHIPFERLLAALEPHRDLDRTPLFQVFLNLLNFPRPDLALPGLKVEVSDPPEPQAKFDLTLYARVEASGLELDLVYDADLFEAETAAELLEQLRLLTAAAVADPEREVYEVSLLSTAARAVLPDPHQTLDTSWRGSVPERFVHHAARHPEALAVADSAGNRWTYGELRELTDAVAARLAAEEVGVGDPVVLFAHRGAAVVPALLAVLARGGVFVMLDPAYPAARLVAALERVEPRTVLFLEAGGEPAAEVEEALERLDARGVVVPADRDGVLALGAGLPPAPAVEVGPESPAYIALTSGSTGLPKGVVGRHGSLTHFTPWMAERFGFSEADRFSLLSALAHDPLHRDVFTPLQLGASIHIPDPEHFVEPGYLAGWLQESGATVAHFTPAMARLVTEGLEDVRAPELRWSFLVGEALTRGHVARLRTLAPEVQCVNFYGSTESQRAVGYYPVSEAEAEGTAAVGGEVLPLGRGMEDVQLLVLSPSGGLAGLGELGEVAVRSPHIALGYLGDEELTRSRFTANPFTGKDDDPVYRTGDLARYRGDGCAVFAGRADQQVKIRGFRVELAEIEAVLGTLDGVQEAVVTLRKDGAQPVLAAFVVFEEGEILDDATLRRGLGERLPDYMVPSVYVPLDALPLTPNRKIDRGALDRLPLPERAPATTDRPANARQEILIGLWQELLGREDIGPKDDFFALGGHSLAATRLAARIRSVFGVELPLRALFEQPTVAGQAELLKAAEEEGAPSTLALVRRDEDGPAPLSHAQQRLWFLDQLNPGTAAFNLPFAFRLEGALKPAALEAAFAGLVARHETLRTIFEATANGPRLRAATFEGPLLPQVDLEALPADRRQAEVDRRLAQLAGQPFDLARGPLVRAVLLCTAADEHTVGVSLHHIISDGWSTGVMVREVAALYGALAAGHTPRLPELPVSYGDFAAWQRRWLADGVMGEQLAWWRGTLEGWPQVLELPTDRERPKVASGEGATLPMALPEELHQALRGLCRERGVTLFMTVLAAYQVLLHHLSGAQRLLVGTDVANRRQGEVEGLVGFFVNQLVLPADLSGDPTFGDLLAAARESALTAFAHQDVPFDRVVDALTAGRTLDRSPLFQTKLIVQNAPFEPLQLPELELSPVPLRTAAAQQDLVLALWEGEDGLSGWVNFSTDLFDTTTIRGWMNQLEIVLRRVAERPDTRLEELRQLLTAGDRRRRTMQTTQRRSKPSLGSFLSRRPASVGVETRELVKKSHPVPGGPLLVEANGAGVDLVAWAREQKASVLQDLHRHGGILFRGFPVETTEIFEGFAAAVCDGLFDENGEHPHDSISGNVYTPIFYAPTKKLMWHNENSFNYRWPCKILFCCAQPAETGGETPFADSRAIHNAIDPEIRQRWIDRGVMYHRNYGNGVGLDWREVFHTEDRSVVERYCRENRLEMEWREDGGLRTRCTRPAVIHHPVTGEVSWFNQALHWHLACLDEETRRSLTYQFAVEDLPRNCTFGDGSEIPSEDIHHIVEVYERLEVALPWQKNDVMILDNILAAHARNPYSGDRKLWVAMGDMGSYGDLRA